MAVEHGCVVLTAQNVTDGTVTVTPAATPVQGVANINYQRQAGSRLIASEQPRPTVVAGATLVITLNQRDRVGRKLCWVAYD